MGLKLSAKHIKLGPSFFAVCCVMSLIVSGLFISAQSPVSRSTPLSGPTGLAQTCTNQVLTSIDVLGNVANCKTVTSAYVDGSIAKNGATGAIQDCYDSDASHTGGAGVEFSCSTGAFYTPVLNSTIRFRFAAAGNTANPSINVNGIGNKTIVSPDAGNNFGNLAANAMIGDATGGNGIGGFYYMTYQGSGANAWTLQYNTPVNPMWTTQNAPTVNGVVKSLGISAGEGPGGTTVDGNFLLAGGAVTKYSGTATVGLGVPAIYGTGRKTAQTAASGIVATFTPANDGSFYVSANVLVTASTAFSFAVTVTYTDESNTSRTLTLTFSQITGTLLSTITSTQGLGPYEGVPLHLRVKGGTAITVQTTAGGIYTTVTYNIEAFITQIG